MQFALSIFFVVLIAVLPSSGQRDKSISRNGSQNSKKHFLRHVTIKKKSPTKQQKKGRKVKKHDKYNEFVDDMEKYGVHVVTPSHVPWHRILPKDQKFKTPRPTVRVKKTTTTIPTTTPAYYYASDLSEYSENIESDEDESIPDSKSASVPNSEPDPEPPISSESNSKSDVSSESNSQSEYDPVTESSTRRNPTTYKTSTVFSVTGKRRTTTEGHTSASTTPCPWCFESVPTKKPRTISSRKRVITLPHHVGTTKSKATTTTTCPRHSSSVDMIFIGSEGVTRRPFKSPEYYNCPYLKGSPVTKKAKTSNIHG